MINDLFKGCPKEIKYSLFADDAAMWVVGAQLTTITSVLQVALRGVEEWCHRWGLRISIQKTKAMIFTNRNTQGVPILKLNHQDIEYVARHKFLGMLLDRRLTWAPHISQLRETCQKDLRVLAVLASRRWGASADTLSRIYTALIRSKLDYGGFLLSSAAPTNRKKLERVQFAGLRIVLGAMRCTETNKLEAEANIPPLDIIWKEGLAKYAARVLSIEDHPVAKAICDFYPYHFYYDRKMPLPCIGLIHEEYNKMNIAYRQIGKTKMHCMYS